MGQAKALVTEKSLPLIELPIDLFNSNSALMEPVLTTRPEKPESARRTMKAAYLDKKAGPDSLVLGKIPRSNPKKGEVVICVHATAITPTELQWFPTFNLQSGESRPFPIVLGHEFSGVVESVGPDVSEVTAGEEVYGVNDWFTNGAQAEYCVAPANALARKPVSLDHVQSAVVPISALTAWQGLFEKIELERGQRVLIHGAAGAVGTFAVQLAHWRGAHVIATASAANLDFVRTLGADEVIDYKATRFEDVVQDVDAVFDVVGGETLDRSWGVVKEGGKLVTVASTSEGNVEQRARDAFMLMRADGPQLTQIAKTIDEGDLLIFVGAVFPLSQAREAYARAQHTRVPGKIVLRVVE
jgi:NADPH:quinone reductase-like Zn-dependent oxidoreductase